MSSGGEWSENHFVELSASVGGVELLRRLLASQRFKPRLGNSRIGLQGYNRIRPRPESTEMELKTIRQTQPAHS